MKKKELLELMGDTAEILAAVSSESEVLVDGDSYEVHRLAHGGAVALGMAMVFAKKGKYIEPNKLAAAIVGEAVDWERSHPELMGEGDDRK